MYIALFPGNVTKYVIRVLFLFMLLRNDLKIHKMQVSATHYPNACLNRYVFNCLVKESTESAALGAVGRAFHSSGAKTSKTRSPHVFMQIFGTDSKFSLFDLSD